MCKSVRASKELLNVFFCIPCQWALDLEWISKVRVNTQAVLKRAQQIQGQKILKKQWQVDVTFQLCPLCVTHTGTSTHTLTEDVFQIMFCYVNMHLYICECMHMYVNVCLFVSILNNCDSPTKTNIIY